MAIITVFQHGELDAGRFGVTLRDHGFKLDVRRPHVDGVAAVPHDLTSVGGVLILGGAMNVTDIEKYPWMQAEAELIRKAHEAAIPVIGLCLGAQLIGHSLGGKVAYKEGSPELGFVPVTLTAQGQTETAMAGIPWNHLQPFSCEQEVAQLPLGATPLMTSKNTKNAAFKVGIRTYGFQFHPECDRPLLDAMWKGSNSWYSTLHTSREKLMAETDEKYPNFARVADRLAVNLTTFCFPYRRQFAV